MTYAESFRIRSVDARQIIQDMLDSTANWQQVATGNGIPKGEVSRFHDAFEGLRKPLGELVS